MRPVRLALENFGPYRERAELDFTRLGDFFLICGKTGSGKSTLFDAMTYALFGKAPGARDGLEAELASDFSAPGDKPYVEFEFELSGLGFRVERVAPHQRPKRGGGLVDVPASAVLAQRSGSAWLPLADGVKEVGAKVSSLVGLTEDEFSKVILLPQGAFQNFLEMKSSDRASVLEKLFPVAIYDTISELSKRRSDDAKAELAALDSEIGRISAEEGEDAEARAIAVGMELESALAVEKSASEELRAAERRFEAEKEKAARADLALQAKQKLEELEGRKASAEARFDRIAKARAAAAAQPAISLYRKESADLSDAESRLKSAEAESEGLESRIRESGDLGSKISEEDAAIAVLRKDLFSLQRGVEAWTRRTEALKKVAAAEAEVTAVQSRVKNVSLRMDALRAEIEAARQALAGEPGLRAELEALEAKSRVLEKLSLAGASLESQNAELLSVGIEIEKKAAEAAAAEKAICAAREKLGEAESRAAVQAAARLADALVPGEPCPVCGSTEHPKPGLRPQGPKAFEEAAATNEISSARDLLFRLSGDSARIAAERAHLATRRDALLAESRQTQEKLSELALALPGAPSALPDIETQAKACLEEISRLRGALETLKQSRSAFESGSRSLEELRVSLETSKAEAAKSESELGIARAMAAEAERESGAQDPQAAWAKASSELKALQMQKEADEGLKALLEKEKAASQARLDALRLSHAEKSASFMRSVARLAAALRASGFMAESEEDLESGLREASAAALAPSALEAEEKAASEYREALAGARARAASLRSDLLQGGQTPGLTPLEAETAAARKALNDARAASDTQKLELGRLKASIARRAAAQSRRSALAEKAQKLHALSSLLRGDMPGRKLPFKNFVLAMYFREVIARASAHLSLMSDGRYYLSPEDTASPVSGRGRVGLGLKVVDMWTGGERPTGTLSGGEKFLTAISLALGLADTIRDRNGGVSLDSVFIDEGFGSLDDEALDRAINVLDRIRGSRTIGIVSHVQGLRSRIPARIEVEKTPSGSKVTQTYGEPDQA
jgi:exonuclease SbcC